MAIRRTSADAATAVGCTVAKIAKSAIFPTKRGRPVLVVASGISRIDENRVATLIVEKISRAEAEFAPEKTGFAFGGVAPLGHVLPPIAVIDEDLLLLTSIWASAGTPNTLFQMAPSDLVAVTGGTVRAIAVK